MSPTTSPLNRREYSNVHEQDVDQQQGAPRPPSLQGLGRMRRSMRALARQRSNLYWTCGALLVLAAGHLVLAAAAAAAAGRGAIPGPPPWSPEQHVSFAGLSGMILPAALPSLTPPPPPMIAGRKKFGWTSPCQTSPYGQTSPYVGPPQAVPHASQSPQPLHTSSNSCDALPNSCGAEPSAGCSAAAVADSSAGPTQETVAIASAIAAALATLDGIGGSAQQDGRISQALRYIAENPAIALSPPPALHQKHQ